ncbi:MAG: hypothetical protein R2734_01905 [Nocardioides sp.]
MGLQELWHADAMAKALDYANLDDDYDLLAEPATGGGSSARRWCTKGCCVATPVGLDLPAAMHLENTTGDPRAPDIKVGISGFSRPVLSFDVALREAPPLTRVFVAHLKSKLPAEVHREPWYDKDTHGNHRTALGSALSTIRRTAEATGLRILLTEVLKGTVTPVIVLGDLNDGQHNTINITEQPRYLVGDTKGGGDVALAPPRRCRSTETPATSTTPTSTRTCASRWTTCWSASSSTTTPTGGSGSSTG